MARLIQLLLITLFAGFLSFNVRAQRQEYFVSDPTGGFAVVLPGNVLGEGFYLRPPNLNIFSPGIYATDNQDWQLYLSFYARDPYLPPNAYPLENMLIVNHWFSSMLSIPSYAPQFSAFNQLFLTCASAWLLTPIEQMFQQTGTFQLPVSFGQIYNACEQNGLIEDVFAANDRFGLSVTIPGSPQTGRMAGRFGEGFVVLATHYDFASGSSQRAVDQIINSLQWDGFEQNPYANPSVYSQFMTMYQQAPNPNVMPQVWQPSTLPQSSSAFDDCLSAASGGDYSDYMVCIDQ